MKKNDQKKLDYFDEASKHRIVSEFVVSYFAHKIKIDTMNVFKQRHWFSKEDLEGKDARTYIDETAQNLKFKSWQIFQTQDGIFFIEEEDQEFKDVNELCKKYAGMIEIPESERQLVERRLYPIIMELMKGQRIEGKFDLQPYRDMELEKLTLSLERLAKLTDNLEKRVGSLEKLAGMIPR